MPLGLDSGKPLKPIKLTKFKKMGVLLTHRDKILQKNKKLILQVTHHTSHIPHHKLHVNLYVLQNIYNQISSARL